MAQLNWIINIKTRVAKKPEKTYNFKILAKKPWILDSMKKICNFKQKSLENLEFLTIYTC